jgi:hypothetical protein
MRTALILSAAALALAACATPARYAPAITANGPGFHEQQIEPNRFRVGFRAGQGSDPVMVNDYALLRAAELTLQQGYDWFQVVDRFTDVPAGPGYGAYGGGPRLSIGGSSGSFGRSSYSSAGVGVGFSLPLGGQQATGGASSLEIVMGRGARPSSYDVYDARSVQSSIGPRAAYGGAARY